MRLFKSKKSGVYYIAFARGKEKSLKTKNKALAQTMFEEYAIEYVVRNRIPEDIEDKHKTLAAFTQEYVLYKEQNNAANTARIDQESLDKLIEYLPAGIELLQITEKHAEKFVSHLTGTLKNKATTANINIRHIKAAFNKAVKWKYLAVSPFANIDLLDIEDQDPRAASLEAIQSIFEKIREAEDWEFEDYLCACLYTGGRRFEAAKIQWPDFKCTRINGEDEPYWTVRLINLKNKKKKFKTLPVAKKWREKLFRRKQKQGPVFPYYFNQYREASRHFRYYADKAEHFELKLHDMRHTAGTFMIVNGVPQKMVQEILGHSSSKMTELYTKLAGSHLKGATDVLDF